jgi:hypothetical protein
MAFDSMGSLAYEVWDPIGDKEPLLPFPRGWRSGTCKKADAQVIWTHTIVKNNGIKKSPSGGI